MVGTKAKVLSPVARLKPLHRRRKVLLASAEAIRDFVDEYTADQLDQVNVRITHLDSIFAEFDHLETEIEELEEIKEVSDIRIEFQTQYYRLKSELIAKLPTAAPQQAQPSPRVVPAANNAVNAANTINLPQIRIEPFSGSFEEWSTFHDLYYSLIHTNNTLSQIQKFYYLKSVLREDALRLVNKVGLTAENYNVAWTILLERYNKRPLLVKRHIAALFSIPPARKESAQALLDLADEHEKHIAILDKLQPAEQHWNSALIESISRRMDANTLKAWESSLKEGEVVTYTHAIEFMRKRAYILESVNLCQAQQGTKPQQQHPQKRFVAQVATEAYETKCKQCNLPHMLWQCEKFKQLASQARLELVRKNQLCMNCLKGKHFARECKSSSCQQCGRKHHTLLHMEFSTQYSGDGSPSHQAGRRDKPAQHSGDGSPSHQFGRRDKPAQYSGDGSPSHQSGRRDKPAQHSGDGSSSHQTRTWEGPAQGLAEEQAPAAHSQVTLTSIIVPSGISSPSVKHNVSRNASLTVSVPSSNSSSSGQLELPGNVSLKAPSVNGKATAFNVSSSVDKLREEIPPLASPSRINSSTNLDSTQLDSSEVGPLALPVTKERKPSAVLLSTAVVKVFDAEGTAHFARALLDSGSQPNFISERLSQKLKLKRYRTYAPISGIGQARATVRYSQHVKLQSRLGDYSTSVECLILPKLTMSLPSCHVDVTKWKIPFKELLADPQFNISQFVDLILGAELFYELLLTEQIVIGPNLPIMQNTVFGYVVSGRVIEPSNTEIQTALIFTETNLDELLQQFWDNETVHEERTLSQDEEECERHFVDSHSRDANGRYIVRLPLKTELLPLLGDAHLTALRRLRSTERRFINNTHLKNEYIKFMNEYEQLGHMQEWKGRFENPQFVLPHHAVLREESTTTKTRVVFDGSCRGSTQLSLNEVLYTGATVQPALFDTLINFRMPRYAVTADVEKMFRQIWVHPEDRKYQQICWRAETSSPVKMFTLNTVTYGLSSSPFHAARVLNQLAADEGHKFPLAAVIVRNGMYVDDLLTGHDDWDTLKNSCHQLNELLRCGGLQLRKWAANESQLISGFSKELLAKDEEQEIEKDAAVKTLGLIWNTRRDTFKFKIPEYPELQRVTRRIVASEMAQIFDPLGLLGPVVMFAKMFIQGLWLRTKTWDVDLASEDQNWWNKYRISIALLKSLEVPRRVVYGETSVHCFVDASKRGYGCCIYIVSSNEEGKRTSHLLTAKSRVGPVKGQTIPRLELCAALLGSKLVANLLQHTSISGPVTLWSDAMIVLHWIRSLNTVWKPFVSNRVTEIQRLTKNCEWKHIPTKENPADLISRGLWANKLLNNELWWYGPEIIRSSIHQCEASIVLTDQEQSQLEEERRSVAVLTATEFDCPINSLIIAQSTLHALKRKIAWIRRFIMNCRKHDESRKLNNLTAAELEEALTFLLRFTQQQFFATELMYLQSTIENPRKDRGFKSSMKTLNPFIDNSGLIRISGRLQNAELPFDTQCPIILPYDSHVTNLIIRETHNKALHAGPQLLLSIIRQKYWPIKGRVLVKRIANECLSCFRYRPTRGQQVMGQLPTVRVTPERPFVKCGVDYCGPFYVRPPNKGRGASMKIFVAVYICMWTKAVHLETAPGLTSEAFINTLKRVMARRGQIRDLYCDNGRNFVGAKTLLKEYNEQVRKCNEDPSTIDYLADAGITFHFNPARSPHFGGLWEAAVKAFKKHLYKVMKDTVLPMDEFQTLSTQIESILNSRPLLPMTNDPDDINALTPGHLLSGEPPFSLVEPNYLTLPTNRLSQFQRMVQKRQHFWKRWSREYMSLLQQRYKWTQEKPNLLPGALVLLRDDQAPPMKWRLARITATYPGKDGLVRAVQVRTGTGGSYRRSITEVCPLPSKAEDD